MSPELRRSRSLYTMPRSRLMSQSGSGRHLQRRSMRNLAQARTQSHTGWSVGHKPSRSGSPSKSADLNSPRPKASQEAIRLARESYFHDVNSFRPSAPSMVSSGHPWSLHTDVHQDMTRKGKNERLSTRLKSKLKRMFGLSRKPDSALPTQQLRASRQYYGQYGDGSCTREGSVGDEYIENMPPPIRALFNQSPLGYDLDGLDAERHAVMERSRVTSWTDTSVVHGPSIFGGGDADRLPAISEDTATRYDDTAGYSDASDHRPYELETLDRVIDHSTTSTADCHRRFSAAQDHARIDKDAKEASRLTFMTNISRESPESPIRKVIAAENCDPWHKDYGNQHEAITDGMKCGRSVVSSNDSRSVYSQPSNQSLRDDVVKQRAPSHTVHEMLPKAEERTALSRLSGSEDNATGPYHKSLRAGTPESILYSPLEDSQVSPIVAHNRLIASQIKAKLFDARSITSQESAHGTPNPSLLSGKSQKHPQSKDCAASQAPHYSPQRIERLQRLTRNSQYPAFNNNATLDKENASFGSKILKYRGSEDAVSNLLKGSIMRKSPRSERSLPSMSKDQPPSSPTFI